MACSPAHLARASSWGWWSGVAPRTPTPLAAPTRRALILCWKAGGQGGLCGSPLATETPVGAEDGGKRLGRAAGGVPQSCFGRASWNGPGQPGFMLGRSRRPPEEGCRIAPQLHRGGIQRRRASPARAAPGGPGLLCADRPHGRIRMVQQASHQARAPCLSPELGVPVPYRTRHLR